MAMMTEEEADALDEFVTNNEITLGPDGSGWLSQREARLVGMDEFATVWLRCKAEAAHTSVGQIINELVREKITAQSA
ncbi:hypothetical protein AGMMS49928_29610 [Spirochaetia bacterium]|nr:hypothetical protein AGMMS49928_29610 [Spirochaetia bacterium]